MSEESEKIVRLIGQIEDEFLARIEAIEFEHDIAVTSLGLDEVGVSVFGDPQNGNRTLRMVRIDWRERPAGRA